jgi:transposase-like protein
VAKALRSIACPTCQNTLGITRHGAYQRQIYLNAETHIQISVTRLRCHACSHTFVLLPASVIPFKRYVLQLVLTALRVIWTKSVYHAEQNLGIATRALRYWRSQFQTWHETLFLSHELDQLQDAVDVAAKYNQLRAGRRFMQIISASAPKFHAL